MSRTREEIRENRQKKINKRRRLLSHLDWMGRFKKVDEGYFANNGEVSKYITAGTAKKTKTKNGHASYRHKRAYGPAVNYSPRDKRQIDRMDSEEEI